MGKHCFLSYTTTLTTALENCKENTFPSNRLTSTSSPICVGVISEKTGNKKNKYHFLRFSQNDSDNTYIQTLNTSTGKYTDFYPRKNIYASGKFKNKISILKYI